MHESRLDSGNTLDQQLHTLVRLAYVCGLAKGEPQAVILDDPLAHSGSASHRWKLDVLADAGRRNLRIIILTCHPQRIDQLPDARRFDLERAGSGPQASSPAA